MQAGGRVLAGGGVSPEVLGERRKVWRGAECGEGLHRHHSLLWVGDGQIDVAGCCEEMREEEREGGRKGGRG